MKYRKKPVAIEAVRFEKPYWKVTEFCPTLMLMKGGNGKLVRFAAGEIAVTTIATVAQVFGSRAAHAGSGGTA